MRIPSLTRKQKQIIGIAAGIFIILLVVGNIVAYRYKKIIHKALPVAVAEATGNLYHISVKRVSINLLNRRITLRGVRIWPDTAIMQTQMRDSIASRNYYHIAIPSLQVSGIMWDKLTGGEGYSCGTFSLEKPDITITKTQRALTIYDTVRKANTNKDFSASDVIVKGARLHYIFGTPDTFKKLVVNQLDLELNDWLYNNVSVKDTSRFLLAEYGAIKSSTVVYEPPHSFYRWSTTGISYNTDDNRFIINNLSLKLKHSKEEFWKQQPEQKEIYDLNFPTVELAGIDRHKLLRLRELHVPNIYLNNPSISIFLSRLLPENTKSKMGRFPNQLIQKMRLPINVNRVIVANGTIVYSEISDKTGKQASIYFDNLNGQVSNITNIPTVLERNNNCMAKLDCKLNKYADMNVVFNLSLTDTKGAFAMNANIENLQGRHLSEQTKAFALVEIRGLNMKSLQMQLTGNEDAARSHFTMLYNNLGIKILSDSSKLATKKRKGLISFIANNMILYSANPMPGEKVRSINTYEQRDELKSFFNLIWRNILHGVRETTIRDMEVIRWLQKNEKAKKAGGEKKLKEIFKRDRKRARKTNATPAP